MATKRSNVIKQVAVNVPTMAVVRDMVALKMHLQIEALIEEPTAVLVREVAGNLVSLTHARASVTTLNTDAAWMAIKAAGNALADIQDRFDRMRKYGVSENEARVLRMTAGPIDRLIGRIPVNKLAVARAHVDTICYKAAA